MDVFTAHMTHNAVPCPDCYSVLATLMLLTVSACHVSPFWCERIVACHVRGFGHRTEQILVVVSSVPCMDGLFVFTHHAMHVAQGQYQGDLFPTLEHLVG